MKIKMLLVLFIMIIVPQFLTAKTNRSAKEQQAYKEHRVFKACIQDMECSDYMSNENIESLTATSTLKHPKKLYSSAMLLDNNPNTAWCEGVSGAGEKETLTVVFTQPTYVKKILLSPMYAKSKATMENNNRPKWVSVRFNGKIIELLIDKYLYNGCGEEEPCYELLDLQSWTLPKKLQEKPISKIELIIDSVITGEKYNDTCISELGFVKAEDSLK